MAVQREEMGVFSICLKVSLPGVPCCKAGAGKVTEHSRRARSCGEGRSQQR